eukprot:GHVU01232770.1.p1 GENE.GHVU01232770.1~~GHVU01232770.1.p1  ORF type:complete len:199 (+),score=7.86 GHVU01232770.1:705-1301(+)
MPSHERHFAALPEPRGPLSDSALDSLTSQASVLVKDIVNATGAHRRKDDPSVYTGSGGVALMLVKAAQTAVPEEERRSMLTSAHNLVHSATVRDRPTFLMGPTGISCIQVRARVSASVCVWYVYVYVYVSYVCASYVGRLLTYARSECVGRVCPHRILPRARVLGMDGCVRVCVRMCVRMCMCVGVCVGVCVRVCVCE